MRRVLAISVLPFVFLLHCVGDDPGATVVANDAGDVDSSTGGIDAARDDASPDSGDAGPPAPVGAIDWHAVFPTTSGNTAVASDGAGNVLLATRFQGTNVAFGGTLLTSTNFATAVVKIAPGGNVTWAKKIDGPGNEQPIDISVDGAGDVYVAGQFDGATIDASGQTASHGTNTGRLDGFVAKLSGQTGAGIWARGFTLNMFAGGLVDIGCTGVKARGDKVAFACEFQGTLNYASSTGGAVTDQAPGQAVLAGALDPATGAVTWSQVLKAANGSSTSIKNGGGVEIDPSGNVYVAGRTQAADMATRTNTTITGSARRGSSPGYVVKLVATSGAPSWIRIFGTNTAPPPAVSSNAPVRGLALDPVTSALYAVGLYTFADFGKGDVLSTGANGTDDGYVVKLDANASGTTVWQKVFGGTNPENVHGVSVDPWGQPIVAGVNQSNGLAIDGKALPDGNGIFVMKLDPSSGVALYVTGRTSGGSVVMEGLATTPSGHAILSGYFTGAIDLKTSVTAPTNPATLVVAFTP